MNSKYLFPFFIASLFVLVSCSKENQYPVTSKVSSTVVNTSSNTGSNPVVNTGSSPGTGTILHPDTGKWLEKKLRLYAVDNSGVKLYDTTYFQPFTNADYAGFNSDGTFSIGSDHYYYPNVPGQTKFSQQIPASTAIWNYKSVGTQFVLSMPDTGIQGPGGFVSTGTVTIQNDTLMHHVIEYSVDGLRQFISDSYYTK